MKIFLALVFLLGGHAFAGSASASSDDCVLFMGDNTSAERIWPGGNEQLAKVETAAIALAWVRDGAVLETYNFPFFRGEPSSYTFDPYDPRYERAEGGAFFRPKTFGNAEDRAVVSFRCRPLGDELPHSPMAPYSKLRSFGKLGWSSFGHFPDLGQKKRVELAQDSGLYRLKVHTEHAHRAYGTELVDWVLELDSGRLTKTSQPFGSGPAKVEEFSRATGVTAFAKELKAMEDVVSVIKLGIRHGYYWLPPKPELHPVLDFLRNAQFHALYPSD